MERILYFDCFAGISGDMTIGALLDLGVNQEQFLSELEKLNISNYRIEIKRGLKNGISGTDFNVVLEHHHHDHDHEHHHHDHEHRNLHDINHIIEDSHLKDTVKELSKKIFSIVAEAEAKVHGKPIEEVHFHEVGAIDSIVDIVGTAICIDMLGVDKIYASSLQVGSGFVECAHGTIPVPAPATMEILKGIPIYNNGIKKELTTPTGAAIVKALASEFGDIPNMELENVGYGLGKRDLKIPNLLRVSMGVKKKINKLIMLETNIDDMNPELYTYTMEKAFEKGALDVFMTPIIMKKNRPGIILSILCEDVDVKNLEELLFLETTTLGLRKYSVDRSILERKFISIETKYGSIPIKLGYLKGRLIKHSPEYEECKKLAIKYDVPIKDVYEEASCLSKEILSR